MSARYKGLVPIRGGHVLETDPPVRRPDVMWWFADAPDATHFHGDPHWVRYQHTEADLWVVDQRRLPEPFPEPLYRPIGTTPGDVLEPLVDEGLTIHEELLVLGPKRNKPCEDVTRDGDVWLVTFNGSLSVGVAWHRAGYTMFATYYD